MFSINLLFILCVWLFAHMYVGTSRVHSACGSQKRVSDLLGQKF